MIACDTPFILLDDARISGAAPARLYRDPLEVIVAHEASDLPALFEQIRTAQASGMYVAGYLSYDAQPGRGIATEIASSASQAPVAWFGIFNEYQEFSHDAVPSWLPDPRASWMGMVYPDISHSDYAKAFAKVQEYIRAGDIYQANLTFRASAPYAGHPLALYAALRSRAVAGYGGVIWTGEAWHLSFSPELFFALKDGHVTTKPMKGTAERQPDAPADLAARSILQKDPKQRAENLMIVDLLRNDLSRVCVPGSVDVPELFKIESYPTIHQMVSVVTGEISPGKDAVDIIKAIFPCGSITGAPKIRAMEVIDELEESPRRLYCGSIGRIDADGSAAFNVAIRTFSLCEKQKRVSLGLGSGVVADSTMRDEWAECLAKGEFAKVTGSNFDLIETMRFEPAEGILRLELHLERMKESARALDFEFDRHEARNRLHAATFHLEIPSKLRLLLARGGAVAVEIADAPAPPKEPLNVSVVPLPVDSSDFRLMHKTTDRGFLDDARIDAGTDEVLFADKDGYLTEASRSAIFVERGGKLATPPLSRGLLPGVLRRELLEKGEAVEADLCIEDLADGFFLGSSLRGLVAAKIVAQDGASR
ncbi:MAG: aminodeoxychorismate synthase component I [Sphingorhabdus sp.]